MSQIKSAKYEIKSDLKGNFNFGTQTRQMLNLWSKVLGVGIQDSTLYYRSNANFAWFKGGIHSNTALTPGTGGTLLMKLDTNGNLTANKFISTIATGTSPLSVTSTTVNTNLNADMLDGNHSTAFATSSHTHSYLPLAGGTITGNLTANKFTSTVATGTSPLSVTSTTVNTNLNADMVDGKHSTDFAPTSHTHTDLTNATSDATASTIVKRDASGDINLRLLRPTYGNQTTISGAIAFRINNSTDNYVRFCSDAAAIRTFIGCAASSHTHTSLAAGSSAGNHEFYSTDTANSYSNAAIELREVNCVGSAQSSNAYAPMLAFHWGGRVQSRILLGSDNNLKISISNGTPNIILHAGNIGSYSAGNVTTPSGTYKHLGAWGVSRTAAGAILVNTAYVADYAANANVTANTANTLYMVGVTTNTTGNKALQVDASTYATKDGYFYATRVYNAVFNDYAEFFPRGEDTETGDIIALDINSDNEQYIKANNKSKRVIGIQTNEFAHIIGGENPPDPNINILEYNLKKYIPIGLAGRCKVKVIGKVEKGDYIVPSEISGIGRIYNEKIDNKENIVGFLVESDDREDIRLLKVKIMG